MAETADNRLTPTAPRIWLEDGHTTQTALHSLVESSDMVQAAPAQEGYIRRSATAH